jgi:hypothetical protein
MCRSHDLGGDLKNIRIRAIVPACVSYSASGSSAKPIKAPFSWLQADHRIPNSHGGPTSTVNGDGVCDPDNLYKADGAPLPERNTAAFTNYPSPMEATRS